MREIPPIESLGRRIMISGPSSTGKSTLAVALGRRLDIPVHHLDRMRHRENTDWELRPDPEFIALHDAVVVDDSWVMDGNYTKALPQRLERATAIVLLSDNRWNSLVRYFRRTLFQRVRAGALEGTKDSVKWAMIRWILIHSPRSQKRFRKALAASGLPMIEVRGMRGVNALYEAWGLSRG